jgi:hypothetical protein
MAEYLPTRTIEAMVKGVYWAPRDTFVSEPLEVLNLTYDGIPGDRHAGLYRNSGPREPWYPRGTPMRNERQLSILSAEENAEVAAALAIDELRSEWIGGNILLSGVPQLSQLPPRTLLMFPSGATVRIDGDNGPCKKSGAAIAANVPGRPDLEFGFVKAAKHKRGLLGWVEREGEVSPGDVVRLRIWEQSLYTA